MPDLLPREELLSFMFHSQESIHFGSHKGDTCIKGCMCSLHSLVNPPTNETLYFKTLYYFETIYFKTHFIVKRYIFSIIGLLEFMSDYLVDCTGNGC